MLGALTPSSAERASTRSGFSKEISLQPNSRYTLSADEGVRAPSNRRLISNFDDFLGKAQAALRRLHGPIYRILAAPFLLKFYGSCNINRRTQQHYETVHNRRRRLHRLSLR